MIKPSNRGVSPVIGVLLLLGLTVGFVAFTSNVLFTTFDSSASPQTEIEITHSIDGGSVDNVRFRIIRNQNVDRYTVIGQDGGCSEFDVTESGKSETVSSADSCPNSAGVDSIKKGDTLSFRGNVGSGTFVLESYTVPG